MARAQQQQQRVYTPPPHVSARPPEEDDGGARRQYLVFGVLLLALATLAIVVWNAYSAGPVGDEAPFIAAEGEFKSRVVAEEEPLPTVAIDQALAGEETVAPEVSPRPRAEEPLAAPVPAKAPRPAPEPATPRFAADGAFLVQIAALRSEAAANAAWERFEQKAPSLFKPASKDVQRADLGGQGVYYRVRAGYFAGRGEAARFCDQVKALGQGCIVVAR